jgi:Reverse transcriptase (RNA-dependent DNA polymerase)
MDETLQQIADLDNLAWAFRKADDLYRKLYEVVDEFDLARFQLSLGNELLRIRRDFLRGQYLLSPIRLMPIPKKPLNGASRLRQFFQVAFRDQVAWIAVVNVIGPSLDQLMPAWVYGYRLYRFPYPRVSLRDSPGVVRSYTHYSGELYRDFKDSWPLYRRHFEQAARCASSGRNNAALDGSPKGYIHPQYVPRFTKPLFWRTASLERGNPYFARFDFKEFYPSISLEIIKRNLKAYCAPYRDESAVRVLIDSMLAFQVDASKVSDVMRNASEPRCSSGPFGGLPTGLLVAGFLANIAMLAVDVIVDKETMRRKVAQFRYIDDHTFLASSDSELWGWLTWYKTVLDESGLGVAINEDKTDPPGLGVSLRQSEWHSNSAIGQELSSLSAVSTRTLAEISTLDREDFGILTLDDQENRLDRLRNLLLDDLPKAEIEVGTRRAFAATRIANLAPWLSRETPAYHKFQEESISLERRIIGLQRRLER